MRDPGQHLLCYGLILPFSFASHSLHPGMSNACGNGPESPPLGLPSWEPVPCGVHCWGAGGVARSGRPCRRTVQLCRPVNTGDCVAPRCLGWLLAITQSSGMDKVDFELSTRLSLEPGSHCGRWLCSQILLLPFSLSQDPAGRGGPTLNTQETPRR